MSSAPTQIAVAPSASSLVAPSPQMQKDFLEEPLARQNSLGNRVRGGGSKGKHLTRSHAMRESASPPRTPTPRSELSTNSPASGHSSSSETINDSRVHVQSSPSSSTPPSLDAPTVIVSSQQQQNHNSGTMYSGTDVHSGNSGVICNQSQLDVEFPKLTPPKSSKSPRGNGNLNRDNDKTMNNNQTNEHSKVMSNSICTHTISNVETSVNGRNKSEMNKQTGHNNNNSHMMTTDIHHVPLSHSHHQNHHHIEQNGSSTNNVHHSSLTSSPSQLMSSPPNLSFDKENRSPRGGCGINGNNNCAHPHEDSHNNMAESPTESSSKCERLGKKHRSGANAKGSKPRLKNMGSSSSVEGGNSTSGFISRDSSTEQFTDQSGVDLVQFFRETLNKNPKDRNMLMRIEKDLTELAHDKTRTEIKFPAMSSYNRMLIHRVAAFFGMEHNVDTLTQQSVIVATTKSTRIPETRFKSLFRDRLSEEPRKSILKRDSHSFDDTRQGLLMCPDRGVLDRKAKSFEEREEEYEKVRRRIFRGRECIERTEEQYWPWSSSDSSDQSARLRQNNKLLRVQSSSVDAHTDGRPSVSKSHSFGGYGGPPQNSGPLSRGDSINSTKSAGPRLFSKQDSTGSTNTPWRLSPSSSGYKTQTQSLRSDSVTPSPTGYGSDDHTPEPSVVQSPPAASCGVVWAVTDMASVPRGSVLINPQTLQPIVNQDGSIYHFDPSNLPPSQIVTAGYNKTMHTPSHRKKYEKQKSNKCEQTNCSSANDNCGKNNNNNNINKNSENSNMREVNSNSRNTITTESSAENLSESSSQTVLIDGNQEIEEDEIQPEENEEMQPTIDAKEKNNHREMSDIQEESASQSLDDIDNKSITNVENLSADTHSVPKLKNQATSPNIPSPEPDQQPTQFNEVSTTNNSSTEASSSNQTNSTESTSSSYTSSTVTNENRKEDNKSTGTNLPIVGYAAATPYQNIDGSTMFSLANPTTYQGPDGSVYAASQQMVYAYPPPVDAEVPTYFMPVYDQSSQRDANGSIVQATGPAIYQPTTGTTAVVPVAYSTAPYNGTPIYPGQVVYSPPDQFTTTAPAAAGQMQQYPVSCPMSYPYPYTGYWGQAMAYYVPPAPVANAVPSTMIPSALTAVNNANSLASQQHNNNNSGSGGKRNSPPQQNISSGNTSQSATPANTYQFASGVPLAFTEPNMPTMYAIPPSAVFPNMLPYTPAGTPSTPAGVFSHLPHHQHSAVINPLITPHPPGPLGPPIPVEPSPSNGGGFMLSNSNGNHGNNSGTPHSAPSTPLSNSLPMQQQQRNPPLFSTPPILPNGCASQIHHSFHQSYNDASTVGSNSYAASQSYERKSSNNNHSNSNSVSNSSYSNNNSNSSNNNSSTGGNMKKNNNNHIQHSGKHSFTSNQQNQRKMNAGENTNQNSQNGNNRPNNQSIPQQKRMNVDKTQTANSVLSNGTSLNSAQMNSDKPRTGIRPKPANLDLRRSASQRNSPSTNSAESTNNSPNSIVSNHHMNSSIDHSHSVYMTRGTHIPQMHPPTAAAVVAAAAAAVANDAACHQQLIGAYNPTGPTGMYVKYGQTYFTHPSMALPSNRRSPPSDFRPPLAPLTGVYPTTVNMMLPAPRHMQPRHPNHNYKGNKPSR